jgi:alkylation response protein AidB-like acyl-CoA dehydrogenase
VHFHFDEDQLALRDAMRVFCADRMGLDRVAERELRDAEPGVWRELAALGVLGILDPAAGGGLGLVEATIVFEELGRHLASGPVLWSTLAAPLVSGVAEGEVRVAGVVADGPAGVPVVVEHGREADVLLVLHDDRVELVERGGLEAAVDGEPLDPMTPAVVLASLPSGAVVGDESVARTMRLRGTSLGAAALVGVAQGALDVARSYALEREQFGVPIGSFQAVKHLLADMFVRCELARAETTAAAAIVADPAAGDPHRATSGAKILAGDAALANGRAAVQVLGGMGFTWDMLPHRYLKRAWVLEHTFGTGSSHAERLGAQVGEEVAARAG